MKIKACLLLAAAFAGCSMAAETASSQQLIGWRGNWTGKFLDANPPLKWSKLSKQMKELHCSAEKPKNDQPAGISASCGALTEWLMIGPLPATDAKTAIDEELIKNEAACAPKEGEAVVGSFTWKKVTTPGSLLNFESIYAKDIPAGTPDTNGITPWQKPFVAYASSWVYSATDENFRFRFRATAAAKIYINGTLIQDKSFITRTDNFAYVGEFSAKFNKGWNHVVCKACNAVKGYVYGSSWYIDLGLRAIGPYETTSQGIAWATLLPSYHIANPLIIGDKIYAMAKPGDLVCLRKTDGKVLWMRSTTYFDLLSDAEKQSNPAYAKIAPLVAELNKINATYVERGTLPQDAIQKRNQLHKDIWLQMAQVSAEKYGGAVGHYPEANMPTPVSDGKFIYVWSELGIAVCYDLDGNRKWITMPGARACFSRYASPTIAGGKLIINENPQDKHKYALTALDLASGEVKWCQPSKNLNEVILSPVSVKVGNEDCVLCGRRLLNSKDGAVLVDNPDDIGGFISTPVVDNGTMYNVTWMSANTVKIKLPASTANMTMPNEGKANLLFRRNSNGQTVISSPLYHDGLQYTVDTYGYLYVVDTQTQKVVYEKDLGLGKTWEFDFYHCPDWGWPAIYASPIMAGQYIYVFGMNGTTVVFKPGREYAEVAKNKIEDALLTAMYFTSGHEVPEFFASSPVAEGKRIYVRGGNYLYCIGEK